MVKSIFFAFMLMFMSCECMAQKPADLNKSTGEAHNGTLFKVKEKTAADLIVQSHAIFVAKVKSGYFKNGEKCYNLSSIKAIKGKLITQHVCSDVGMKIGSEYLVFTYMSDKDVQVDYAMEITGKGVRHNNPYAKVVIIAPDSNGHVDFLMNMAPGVIDMDVTDLVSKKNEKIYFYSYYPYEKVISFIKKIMRESENINNK